MKYEIRPSVRFQKDLKRIHKRGNDLDELTRIIKILAADEPLAEKYRDHPLQGYFSGCRECHIAPDWLLIYEKCEGSLFLYLTRTGTHSDLFRK